MPKKENYSSLIWIGLVLTLLAILGLGIYSLNETGRLAKAAEDFNSERVSRGGEIYQSQCVSCHGAQGEGGVGRALNDRQLLKTTFDSVFFSIIRSGVPGTQMPAWSVDFGGPLTDEDVRDLVAMIRAWEPTAPEIQPVVFVPEPARGAVLFDSTCSVCHGEGGAGTDKAPRLNDLQRLNALPDDWYREVIRNGRPAKGMPTWGTVLSPDQVEDLVVLISAWRQGDAITPDFSPTELLDRAIFALGQGDPASAVLHLEHAMRVLNGTSLDLVRGAASQIKNGDQTGALAALQAMRQEWPLGDPTVGAQSYSQSCSACHGIQGEGGIGVKLQENAFIQSQSNAELLDFLKTGRAGTAMAGFADRLNETELANVIAFLRLWQPASQ